MSDPAQGPASPPPAPARRARWMDGLTVLLLCLGAGGAMVGAEPSIARALAPDPPAEVEAPSRSRPHPQAAHPLPGSTTSATDEDPRFAPDDDEPHLTELERMYPDGMWPGQHRSSPRGTPSPPMGALPPSPQPEAPATNARKGHARTALTLRESTEPSARVTGQAPAGSALSVLGESGEWALVVLRGPDGASLFGWTRRAAITVP